MIPNFKKQVLLQRDLDPLQLIGDSSLVCFLFILPHHTSLKTCDYLVLNKKYYTFQSTGKESNHYIDAAQEW